MDIPDDIMPLLDNEEKVLYSAKQKKYRPSVNTESIVITNRRVILRKPFMMNMKKSYTDYIYSDISNIILDKGPLRSTIILSLKMDADDLIIENVPNEMAQRAFRIIRERVDEAKGIPPAT
jgi:PH (Pleckstrin Homology) domain-containing protein